MIEIESKKYVQPEGEGEEGMVGDMGVSGGFDLGGAGGDDFDLPSADVGELPEGDDFDLGEPEPEGDFGGDEPIV